MIVYLFLLFRREEIFNSFMDIWKNYGCLLTEIDCDVHDQHAARSQFLCHFVGRMISNVGISPTLTDTQNFSTLTEVVDQVIFRKILFSESCNNLVNTIG